MYTLPYFLAVSTLSPLHSVQVDEKALKHITEMGFSKEASRQALMDNGNNLEAALNVLLNSSKQKSAPGPPLRGIT